ncbi:3-isopropylmalate dehydratase small subunit [Phocicoccus schoeneichii]|uniref:3-isopropylmalate dehydratase small subunit n=1 Tax=Phocicoccus schoeneichii TaxID=1812261 RepID=A0A6V7RF23_9BACL|nr:3-isopropylmalate dehydratase small subunit [Jeotgalicoccus schoeneichii]GGH49943.1 3-isopropylmalate dehydratase small subunit [Jeotgalicoccus schoeneichii]CAD2075738.1 3-isopropylmalate dehydratase small subunit [Jeotgalicoccus schoeneichii]
MEKFIAHSGKVFALNRENIDTDQIIPKQFLKRIERTGFGEFVFYNWRYDDDGNLRSNFHLDDEEYSGASVLVTGPNFGCGSSREHAPWSLLDYGFKVIIAPSFADIFYNNAFKNGILLITLDEEKIEEYTEKSQSGDFNLEIDLKNKWIKESSGEITPFDISEYHREKLLNGWDDISLTLLHEDKIKEYEEREVPVGII